MDWVEWSYAVDPEVQYLFLSQDLPKKGENDSQFKGESPFK